MWLFMKWAQESVSNMVLKYVHNYNKHKKSELSLQGSVWDIKCLKRMVFKKSACKRKIAVPRYLFVTQEGVHKPWRIMDSGRYLFNIALQLRPVINNCWHKTTFLWWCNKVCSHNVLHSRAMKTILLTILDSYSQGKLSNKSNLAE